MTSIGIKEILDLLYVALGAGFLAWLANFVRGHYANKRRVEQFEAEARVDKALAEATRAIKNLSPDDLAKHLSSELSSGDGKD